MNNMTNKESSSKTIETILLEKSIIGAYPESYTLRPHLNGSGMMGDHYSHPCKWWTHEYLNTVSFSDGSTVSIESTMFRPDDFANLHEEPQPQPLDHIFKPASSTRPAPTTGPLPTAERTNADNASRTMPMSAADELKLKSTAVRLVPNTGDRSAGEGFKPGTFPG